LNSHNGMNNMVQSQNGFSSFSPQPNAVSQQCGEQNNHTQLQNMYQTNLNLSPSTGRLSHPGQHLITKKRRQHEAVLVSQKMLSSSKSIISLNPVSDSSSTQPKKISSQQVSNVQGQPYDSSARNNTQQTRGHGDLPYSSQLILKKETLENQSLMYSSACNASIKAQHKLNIKRDTQMKRNATVHVEIENDENDTKEKTNGSLLRADETKGITSSTVVLTNSMSTSYKGPHQTNLKRKLSFGKLSTNNVLLSNGSGDFNTVKHKYVPVVGGKDATNDKTMTPIFPHVFLQKLLKTRGYSTKHYCSLEGGYYCRPTPLQCASYGTRVVYAVRNSDKKLFAGLLSAGLSRNPCNKFGESILHMVCRRGDYGILRLLVDNGATVQVSDDFGRTPLHDACWTSKPCFKSIKTILEKDIRLLHIVDCRGSPPLEYVKRENWPEWNEFLDNNKEVFWPQRVVEEDNDEPPPELVNVPAHSKPVIDPDTCVSVEQAAMFANGKKEVLCAA